MFKKFKFLGVVFLYFIYYFYIVELIFYYSYGRDEKREKIFFYETV